MYEILHPEVSSMEVTTILIIGLIGVALATWIVYDEWYYRYGSELD